MSNSFETKVVIVTGGSTGMGRATADRLAAEGATVVLAGRRKDVGEAAAAEIRSRGGSARFIPTDVTDEQQMAELIGATVSEFGGLHGVFNNAGGMSAFGAVPDVTTSDWRADLAVNLDSVYFGLKYQIPALLASGGGAVVNNASNLGVVGMATVAAYVAAKHGVVGLTRAAALECAAQGVRVNAITTGGVETPLYAATTGATAEGREMVNGLHPVGRIGRPEEIASFVTYLLSDAASFITGAALAIDGGFTAR